MLVSQQDHEWQEISSTWSFSLSTSSFKISSSFFPDRFASTDSRGFAAPKGFCTCSPQVGPRLYTIAGLSPQCFGGRPYRFATCRSLNGCTLRSSLIAGFQNKPTPLWWFICARASHSDFGSHNNTSTFFDLLLSSCLLSASDRSGLLAQSTPAQGAISHCLTVCQIWFLPKAFECFSFCFFVGHIPLHKATMANTSWSRDHAGAEELLTGVCADEHLVV